MWPEGVSLGGEVLDVRADERRRIAALLDAEAEGIASFAKDAESAVRLVAFLLELPL